MSVATPLRAPDPAHAAPSTWADFQPGDSLFASPDAVFHGRGSLLRAAPRQGIATCARGLLEQAAAAAGADHPGVLLGMLPFDPAQPARLLVPRTLQRMAFPQQAPAPAPVTILKRTEWPSGAQYEEGVRQVLARLQADTALRKVVLSRTLRLDLAQDIAPSQVLARLWRHNPNGYTYAMPLDDEGRALLMGASPELLVRRRGRRVFVHPLAGTAVRDADPDLDARNAQALRHSDKDRREHAVVVEAIEAALKPLCSRLDVPVEPDLAATEHLWHLGTAIVGELADPATDALDLALALHPTPAVCGLPTAAARRAIADIEPFERGYFAGAVGWCDRHGDGVWAVAIRCAEIAGRHLTLSAGAGIVPGSVPAQERIETGNKLRTILDALGLETEA